LKRANTSRSVAREEWALLRVGPQHKCCPLFGEVT
jgi:hypothetical protein